MDTTKINNITVQDNTNLNIDIAGNIINNITLILTSTVNVNLKKAYLYQTNKDDRINTYIKAITQWLNNTKFNIVLVENSGYYFDELNNLLNLYNNRFEIISFKEDIEEDAKYLSNNDSKGASEMFAISYALNHSKLIKQSIFIIKITARFYIPELEEYLSKYDLNEYDCLTQNNTRRCEMVGSHIKNVNTIFNINLVDSMNRYNWLVELVWQYRTSLFKKKLTCKLFNIEKTQRGGLNECFTNI